MPLENPSDILRRRELEKLDGIKADSQADDAGIISPAEEPDDLQTHFRYLDALTTGPFVSHLVELERKGIVMEPADSLSDVELSKRLWEVIEGLAECQVFLSCTDHLNDRELYEHLRTESLIEEHPDMPMGDNACIHLDILGGCSEEDMYVYRKYYADEAYRWQWQKDWPDDPMPDRVNPPYDRDRLLPKHQTERRDEE